MDDDADVDDVSYSQWVNSLLDYHQQGHEDNDEDDEFQIEKVDSDDEGEDFQDQLLKELTEELNLLEEEEMEAAVANLLQERDNNSNSETTKESSTPLRDAAKASKTATITSQQYNQLKSLLDRHYQLLVQQSVLTVRAAKKQENNDHLVEILDGAVGMLQDLDQNRKDAIRHYIQFETKHNTRRTLELDEPRRLTRAQFHKTLHEQSNGQFSTVFDVPGLNHLPQTFSTMDQTEKLLEFPDNAAAVRYILNDRQQIHDFVPGEKDMSENFVDAKDLLGKNFIPPCKEEDKKILKKNLNAFTTGEDNLVLRGVNLYGEKQWALLSDRYMPDRSQFIVSQRYNKLCTLFFRRRGITITEEGDLKTPPKYESIDDVDPKLLATLKPVESPAILNVHRWSLEEDYTLLKAVEIMGNMWAEIAMRYIPHRDRGHLRKRFQVLERRIKGTVTKINAKSTPPVPLSKPPAKTTQSKTSSKQPKATKPSNGAPVSSTQRQKTASLPKSVARTVLPPPPPGHRGPHGQFYPPIRAGNIPRAPVFQPPMPRPRGGSTQRVHPSVPEPLRHNDDSSRLAFESLLNNEVSVLGADDSRMAIEKIIGESSKAGLPEESSRIAIEKFLGDASKAEIQEESSRMAFEKLINGDINEFSRMSHLDEVMQTGQPNQASRLAAFLPKKDKPTGESNADNSIGKKVSTSIEATKVSASTTEPSFLDTSKIRKKTKKSSAPKIRTSSIDNMPPPPIASPKKKSRTDAPPVVKTPSREEVPFFYSTTGTPVGFSPTFNPHSATKRAASGRTMDGFETSRILEFPADGFSQHSLPEAGLSHHSFLVDTDLEAINALSNMSTSPDKKKAEKKSLFDKVVGEKKRKLDFQ